MKDKTTIYAVQANEYGLIWFYTEAEALKQADIWLRSDIRSQCAQPL
jgi:hypothetical protein